MEDSKKQLLKKFKEIAKLKWVEAVNDGTNAVGLTFETLLHKDIDSMYFPDYYGIEIKCSQRYSRYPINLFSISFDGPNLFEMDRILKQYGKPDSKYLGKLQLQGQIYVNKYNKINNNYFKMKLNQETKKGELVELKSILYEDDDFIFIDYYKNQKEGIKTVDIYDEIIAKPNIINKNIKISR